MARRFFQFALDFFGSEPVVPAEGEKSSDPIQKVTFTQVQRAKAAIENIAPPAAVAAAGFRHPRASREAVLAGWPVAYEVKRRKRRTIGFSVGAEGLAVSAPQWVPLHEIDQAVQSKSGWIVKKLHETQERHRQLQSARIDWQDGAMFPFLAEPVRVVLDSSQLQTVLCPNSGGHEVGQTLRVKLPANAAPAQIQQAVQIWLKQQAKPLFASRLAHFAPQLNVQWRKLSLSSATTRWGSASASGSIRLNWQLLHLSPQVIDYVVVHELSHLLVMDHSPRFWATVCTVMPDYAVLRRQLKDVAAPCH